MSDETEDAPADRTHPDTDGTGSIPNEEAAHDPEASVTAPDPTRDLPSPADAVPDPDDAVPDPDDSTPDDDVATDVPRDLWVSFWMLVLVFDAAVLALGVGLLLVTLGDRPDLGSRLVFAGIVVALYGYYRYRTSPYRTGTDPDSDA